MAPAPRIPVLKLVIWCLVIGLVLAMFNASPEDVYAWAGETGRAIANWFWEFGKKIGPYMLMGAKLVRRNWAISYLWRWFKTR